MIINAGSNKPFEKPDSGMFNGVIADVVDLGIVQTKFGPKPKIRIVWVLGKNDSEGRPFRVIRQVTATMNERGQLFDIVKNVFGTAPPAPFESETLIGRANSLIIIKETQGDKTFVNVKGVLALQGTAPTIPADFVRAKDKKNQPGQTQANSAATQAAAEVEDEDIPF